MEGSSESRETSVDVSTWVADYGDDLYRYALLQLRDRHAAEEVVQETFLGALKNHGSYAGRGTVRSWLLSILRNKIVDFIRTRSRQAQNHTLDARPDDALSGTFDENGFWCADAVDWRVPESVLEDREMWATLQQCLSGLPTGQADAFVLSVMHEMSSEEICQQLDITPSNLWVRLHRARLALAKCMGVNWFGETEEGNDGSE